ELGERRVRDAAAQLRVDVRVDRPRREEALDEPRGGAVRHPLELGDVEGRALAELLEDERVRELRRARERTQRALEPTLPAVRVRERLRLALVLRREERKCTQPLALGRRRV